MTTRARDRFAGVPLLVALVSGVCLAGVTGCVKVAPYERGELANPTMSGDEAMSTAIDEHVRAVSEGASGGLSGGGGGCGCN